MPSRQDTLRFDELYIEPVARCNLDCVVCYTDRTSIQRLTIAEVVDFARRLDAYTPEGLKRLFFCGTGEVFMLPDFADMLRACHTAFPRAVIEVQTNGTFPYPALDFSVHWWLSIDGLEADHERNRGPGTFAKTIAFLEAARSRGDAVTVRTIVGAWNEARFARFSRWLYRRYGLRTSAIPRSVIPDAARLGPLFKAGYTHDDALGTASGMRVQDYVRGFDRTPGSCHQISIFYNRAVSFCCEGPVQPCTLSDSIEAIEDAYIALMGGCRACEVRSGCWWCIEPSYNCAVQGMMGLGSCTDVAALFADQ